MVLYLRKGHILYIDYLYIANHPLQEYFTHTVQGSKRIIAAMTLVLCLLGLKFCHVYRVASYESKRVQRTPSDNNQD